MEQLNTIRRPVRRVDISINMEKTGANIRSLIKSSGYSVRDIMAITGISTEQAVYKWYRGESIPSIETMLILCGTLGVDVNELLVIDGDFAFFDINYTVLKLLEGVVGVMNRNFSKSTPTGLVLNWRNCRDSSALTPTVQDQS